MRVKDIKISKNLFVDDLVKFIEAASTFKSDIMIKGANFEVDAKSIIGVISYIRVGINVTILTKGDDEEEALKAISNLLG